MAPADRLDLLLGALLSVIVFPQRVVIAVVLVLSISDSAASLIGIRFGRIRIGGKTLEGSLAFFVTALVIMGLALPGPWWIAAVGALVAAVVEALPALPLGRFELNDNVTVPLVSGAAICGLAYAAGVGL